MDAASLRRQFGVYGDFYQLVLHGLEYPCRSLLEIVHHDNTPLHLPDLLQARGVHLVVMMNPGGSHPADSGRPLRRAGNPDKIASDKDLIPAVPDVTQYQIMRLMHARGWRHVRVVNLSDLREPRSPVFMERYCELESMPGGRIHCLFADERLKERGDMLGSLTVDPVVVAWGCDDQLLMLANRCLNAMSSRAVKGVSYPGQPGLYRHPSPMLQRQKDEWLAKMVSLLG
jgi:hypothetical protein